MGQYITLTARDGHTFDAYRSEPTEKSRGGLVVIQEIFGVNPHIRSVCHRFAEAGYAAVAPAIFDRTEKHVELDYTQEGITRGRELRARLSVEDVLKDLEAAATALQETGGIGAVGYCWGGSLAWLAATRLGLPAVCYYGGMIVDFVNESPRAPVLLHFGETDASIPGATVEKIRSSHPTLPLYTYAAGHGFNCDSRSDYHEPSATLALARTLDFLAQYVG